MSIEETREVQDLRIVEKLKTLVDRLLTCQPVEVQQVMCQASSQIDLPRQGENV